MSSKSISTPALQSLPASIAKVAVTDLVVRWNCGTRTSCLAATAATFSLEDLTEFKFAASHSYYKLREGICSLSYYVAACHVVGLDTSVYEEYDHCTA